MREYDESSDQSEHQVAHVTIERTHDDGDREMVDYEAQQGERHTRIIKIKQFGFSGHAPPGAEGVIIGNESGARDLTYVLGDEHPEHRPKDKPEGASRHYDAAGSYLQFNGDGTGTLMLSSELVAELAKLILNCAVEINGDLTVNGDITHNGNMTTSGVHTDSRGVHT